MKRIFPKLTGALIAILLCAVAVTTATSRVIPAGQAACSRLHISGEWKFVQTNDTSPTFILQQTENGIQGSASYPSFFRMFVKASVDGAIKGDSLEVAAYWDNGSTGVYTGKIGPQGRIQGSTYDRQHPQTIANWYTNRTAKCVARTVETGEQTGTTGSALETSSAAEHIKAQGRVKGPTPNSPLPICESARLARARNSLAAPGLEAKCLAQEGVKPQGGVTLPPGTTLKSPSPICEAASVARARNSPAAPGLETQCLGNWPVGLYHTMRLPATSVYPPVCELATAARARNSPSAPGLETQCQTALAASGAELSDKDPLAVELRNQQPNDSARRGFNIGMGAFNGQILQGRGKNRMCASLTQAEAYGCSIAILFSVERRRNAKLASTGAKIAQADPAVAEARNASTDAFYRLGFDIATGIFGDPTLGARGDTVTGPGALAVREALSGAGPSGFNAAVTFHLSRHYNP